MNNPRTPMTHDQVRDWMLEALRGSVPSEVRGAFDDHLHGCPTCREEFAELRTGWELLGRLPDVHASPALRARSLSVLSACIQGMKTASRTTWLDAMDRAVRMVWPDRPVWQAGVALALLAGGIAIGTQASRPSASVEEVAQLRGEIHAMSRLLAVSLLQQQSASDRLKGVSMSARLDRNDDEITAALLDALKFDPNVNVRLAALEALSGSVGENVVRKEMLTWLPRQNSPLVQLAMVDMLAEDRDATTDLAFAQLIKAEKVNPAVKARVQMFVGDGL